MLVDVVRSSEVRLLTRANPYVLVLLTKPRARRLPLRVDPSRIANVWRMFDDVEVLRGTKRDPRLSYCAESDADAILDVVDEHRERAREILVACDEGEGRSRGVALALALIYGDATTHVASGRPNVYVARTILERFAVRTGREIGLPPIVRYATRCTRHIHRSLPLLAATAGACDLCGDRLEPVPIDIVSNTVLVLARDVSSRALAAR